MISLSGRANDRGISDFNSTRVGLGAHSLGQAPSYEALEACIIVLEVTEGQDHEAVALGWHCHENTPSEQAQRAGTGEHLIGQTVMWGPHEQFGTAWAFGK